MEGKWLLQGAHSHFTNTHQLVSASAEQGFSWGEGTQNLDPPKLELPAADVSRVLGAIFKVSWDIHHGHGAAGRGEGHFQLFPIFLGWEQL